RDSTDGVDHGESCAAFASLTLELGAQAAGQDSWVTGGASLFWLTLAGFSFVILGFVYAGLFGAAPSGVYVPAHMDHGRLTPGRFQ
uniref:DUF6111 family protein n=1 Tax=Rhodoblastus sp. TaxID=1962975 RepID=UPI003F95000A